MHSNISRLFFTLTWLFCFDSCAFAQITSKLIHLIVPYATGGPIDVTARVLAERVKDSLGTVVVENRPGAGGNIGADFIAKAPADGLTIGIAATARMLSTLGYTAACLTTQPLTLYPLRKFCVCLMFW
jgi:tripartite-type tricarboxylate transporter receptor subunit TctC